MSEINKLDWIINNARLIPTNTNIIKKLISKLIMWHQLVLYHGH